MLRGTASSSRVSLENKYLQEHVGHRHDHAGPERHRRGRRADLRLPGPGRRRDAPAPQRSDVRARGRRPRGRSSRSTRPARPTTTSWERARHEEADPQLAWALAVLAAVARPRLRGGGGAGADAAARSARPARSAACRRSGVDLPIVAQATAAHSGFGAQDLQAAYKLAGCRGDARRHADGRARRRVRRPDDRVGPQRLPRLLRAPGPCTTANGCFKKVNQDGEQGNYPHRQPRAGSRRSRSTSRWCRRSARSATSCSSRRTRPTRRSRPRTRCSTATSAPRSTRPSTSARPRSRTATASAGPEPNQTFFDHYYNHPGVAITASVGRRGLRDDLARRLAVRDGRRRHGARPGSRRRRAAGASRCGAALFPGVLPERGAGHRQRLLDLGAEAGLAARRRLRRPHGRGRVRGRRQRRDLRLLARDRRLGRRRRHEHRLTGHRVASTRSRATRSRVAYGSYPYSHRASLFDVTQRLELHAELGVRLPLHRRARLRRPDGPRHAERHRRLLGLQVEDDDRDLADPGRLLLVVGEAGPVRFCFSQMARARRLPRRARER